MRGDNLLRGVRLVPAALPNGTEILNVIIVCRLADDEPHG